MYEESRVNSPYDAAQEVLKIEADKLAKACGVDPWRVRHILNRTACDYAGNPLPTAAPGIDTLDRGLVFSPSLYDALGYLPPEMALHLFETENLDLLAKRIAVTRYLADDDTPLYCLEQLAAIIGRFVSYLERNPEHIVRTGYPRTLCHGSQWLNRRLSKLYCTKLPFETEVVKQPSGELLCAYTWPDRIAESLGFPPPPPGMTIVGLGRGYWWAPDGSARTDGSTPVRPCSYEDAALIAGLDAEDSAWLETDRSKVFDLKLRLLRHLASTLRSRATRELWPGCLDLLTKTLTATEMEFYLRMDRFYGGFDILRGQVVDEQAELVAGGLTDLLHFIGHCEKELTLGTLHQTVGRLISLLPDVSLESYYEVVRRPCRTELDAALDSFVELDAGERAYWSDYRARVNDALENKFDEELVVRIRVKKGLLPIFEPHVRTFVEWQRSYLEATGTLPHLNISQPLEQPQVRENTFRKDGDYRRIVHQGQEDLLRDTKGLGYIAQLLRSPGREYHVLELVAAGQGHPLAPPVEGYERMGSERLAEEGLGASGLGDAGAGIDQQAKSVYERRIRELREQLEEARQLGNWQREDQIEEQIDALKSEIAAAYGLGGRERKAASAAERARVNVRKQIEAARDKVAEVNPRLGHHLRNAIKTGTFCTYEPEQYTQWNS